MSEIRLGLIGAGSWGTKILTTLALMPGVRLDAICTKQSTPSLTSFDIAPAVVRQWSHVFERGCDGVIIATPPSAQAEILAGAMRAGIPAFVEKPLALSTRDAEDLLALERATNGRVLVDHTHLFSPAFERLRDEARRLGPPNRIQCKGMRWGPFRLDVSALWDFGPHDIAMCLEITGEGPSKIGARSQERKVMPEGYGENFELDLTFSCGTHAMIEIGNLSEVKERRLICHYQDRSFVYDDTSVEKLRLVRGSSSIALEVDETLPLTRALDIFVRGIREKTWDRFGLSLGVEVVRILESCDTLLRAGKSTAR